MGGPSLNELLAAFEDAGITLTEELSNLIELYGESEVQRGEQEGYGYGYEHGYEQGYDAGQFDAELYREDSLGS